MTSTLKMIGPMADIVNNGPKVPEDQISPVVVEQKFIDPMNDTNAILNALAGARNTRTGTFLAFFPTIGSQSVKARIEKLFVSDFPIKSYDQNNKLANTTYNHLSYVRKSASGASLPALNVYLSEDFPIKAEETRVALEMIGRMRTGETFVTATAPGVIGGNSYQLALAAALMGLPPVCAYTGGIELQNYPSSWLTVPVGDFNLKATAVMDLDMKLICPVGNFKEDSSYLTTDTIITGTDIAFGQVGSPGFVLLGISRLTELITAVGCVMMNNTRPLIKLGKDREEIITYNPLTIQPKQAVKVDNATVGDMKRMFKDKLKEVQPLLKKTILRIAPATPEERLREAMNRATDEYYYRFEDSYVKDTKGKEHQVIDVLKSNLRIEVPKPQVISLIQKVFNNDLFKETDDYPEGRYENAPVFSGVVRKLIAAYIPARPTKSSRTTVFIGRANVSHKPTSYIARAEMTEKAKKDDGKKVQMSEDVDIDEYEEDTLSESETNDEFADAPEPLSEAEAEAAMDEDLDDDYDRDRDFRRKRRERQTPAERVTERGKRQRVDSGPRGQKKTQSLAALTTKRQPPPPPQPERPRRTREPEGPGPEKRRRPRSHSANQPYSSKGTRSQSGTRTAFKWD